MKLNHRILIAALILAVEVITVFIPIVAIYTAYLLIARPSWFKKWVDELYCKSDTR